MSMNFYSVTGFISVETHKATHTVLISAIRKAKKTYTAKTEDQFINGDIWHLADDIHLDGRQNKNQK